jgi:protein phosphatase
MGGHAAGDYASLTIVQELNTIGVSGSPDDLQARFMERIHRANHTIYEHALREQRGTIGATLVALLVHGNDYACIWSGDSRIYLLRDGKLVQQTRDHTELMMLLDSGAITPEEAVNWPRKNVITRAIGVRETPECDLVTGKLALGDVFILCSDGLTEHLSDEDIREHAERFSPKEACDAMIRLTLERGAKDNVTVIAMRCLPPPETAERDDSIDDFLDFEQPEKEAGA